MSAPKKRGLGRGLEALLGPKAADTATPEVQPGERLRQMPVKQLQPGKYQPRLHMDAGHDHPPVVQLVRNAAHFEPFALLRFASVAGELVKLWGVQVFGHGDLQKENRP